MANLNFPLHKTKMGTKQTFKLESPAERQKYFRLKAGKEIDKIKAYLNKGNTFMGFLVGKKNSGKGTYSKLFMEALGAKNFAHVSVGDAVRDAHKELKVPSQRKKLVKFLNDRYRGFISVDQAIDIIMGRDTTSLLPTEVILALVERMVDKLGRKAIFVDGFPRDLDQISYSLYFRALMGYREDPDFFVFIDIPDTIIDARMKTRVICPICNTPFNLKLLRTKEVGYDKKKKEFYLMCDDPKCKKAKMVTKEGDSLGIGAIKGRLEKDGKIIKMLMDLQGVPKVYLRSYLPVKQAGKLVDDYEITPAYDYKFNKKTDKVEIKEVPWTVKDDEGTLSYNLLPAPVVVSLIKQVAKTLGL
ncbi:MAG: nucleoside monophosphate kinase [Parcubacteria group bacterium]